MLASMLAIIARVGWELRLYQRWYSTNPEQSTVIGSTAATCPPLNDSAKERVGVYLQRESLARWASCYG